MAGDCLASGRHHPRALVDGRADGALPRLRPGDDHHPRLHVVPRHQVVTVFLLPTLAVNALSFGISDTLGGLPVFLINLWVKLLAALWAATFKATRDYRLGLPEWVSRTTVYTALVPYLPLVRRLLIGGLVALFLVLLLASNWSR